MNAHFPGERYKMVFAEAGDVDVLDDHHFVMIFGEYSVVDDVCTNDQFQKDVGESESEHTCQTLLVSLGQEHQRLRIAYGCLYEALAVGILAYAFEQRSYGASKLLFSRSKLFGCRMEAR